MVSMRSCHRWVWLAWLAGCNATGADAPPAPPPAPSAAERAARVANEDPDCVDVQPFYWEIGDASGLLASGTAGGERFTRDDKMLVASASKWLFGAYVAERFDGAFTDGTRDALRMRSGYVGFDSFGCRNAATVQACMDDAGAAYDPAADGKFDYDGGHFQRWGIEHGLGEMDDRDLAAEYAHYLGADVPLQFSSPQLAGGLYMSPAAYARFLQHLLAGDFVLSGLLGKDAVCTLPSSCDAAVYSPAPFAWHYSYGHWVEDDAGGDGAFSSAGLFGFYPWIDAAKAHYGMVARVALDVRAAVRSGLCGIAIRHAYLSPQEL